METAALGITVLLENSKCSFTQCKFRFFILSCLVLPSLATFPDVLLRLQ